MKLQAEDLWPLVLDFIKNYVGKAELKAFKKHFSVKDLDESEDPLVKAGGMQAMLTALFKADKKAYKAFVKAKKSAKADDSDSDKESKTLAGKKRKRADSQASDAKVKKRKRTDSVKSNGSTGGGPVTRSRGASEIEETLKNLPQASKESRENTQAYHFKRIQTAKYDN